ncbi:hypothetical protein SLEP1_g57943 [Rubroshorea leprosula]|uniref:Uncharacterized protein n=1 Tax=Rubroshorea leprosula TaxID=152421 RepID=A0AAV5MMN8_9ROSI|nr:hypothetical protein SLEP1_g57943 [Rubroshorea leprosula]
MLLLITYLDDTTYTIYGIWNNREVFLFIVTGGKWRM